MLLRHADSTAPPLVLLFIMHSNQILSSPLYLFNSTASVSSKSLRESPADVFALFTANHYMFSEANLSLTRRAQSQRGHGSSNKLPHCSH